LWNFSERAETKQALQNHYDKDASESDNSFKKVARKGKAKAKHDSYKSREDSYKSKASRPAKELDFYCSYHKANDTHDTTKCKVLNGDKDYKQKKTSFADDKNKKDSHRDKAKYKSKSRDMHLLQEKLEVEKAKFRKLNIRLNARLKAEEKSDADESSSGSEEEPQQRTFKPKEELFSSSSSSEHASGTESESSQD
jgi:hypothetical protein